MPLTSNVRRHGNAGSDHIVPLLHAAIRVGRPSTRPANRSLVANKLVAPLRHMSSRPIAAVMVHVPNVTTALAWYQQAFPSAVRSHSETADFECLSVGDVQLELVHSDEKVSSGACGSVVHWWVTNLVAALRHLQSIGATLYRGPMQIEAGLSMCQVRDPWGNCIGLRGPLSSSEGSP